MLILLIATGYVWRFSLTFIQIHVILHSYYYRKQLKEETGKDNYEQALYWARRSLNYNSESRKRIVIERTVCHILWHASQQAEKDGKLKEAWEYTVKSVDEWEVYLEKHPEDPGGIARSFLEKINKKRLQFEQKIQKGKLNGKRFFPAQVTE